MLSPVSALGAILKFCEQKRMILKKMIVLDGQRRMMHIVAPLAEIIFNFFGVIKSLSQGFATFDYVFLEYRVATIVRLDLRLNGEPVSGLSRLLHSSSAVATGQKLCLLLKQLLPRQNFVVPIQAVVNNKIIARETLSASRKNVTAGLYGGDITRKKKVLMRQKKGKQRLRQFGKVRVSHKIYLQVLKYN